MQPDTNSSIAKALADAETANRRATMALQAAREPLRLAASTPRIAALLKEIDKELGFRQLHR